MHTGLGAQPAVGVFALYFNRRTLDAGDLARVGIDHFAAETVCRAPAQVHAQQHLRPILGLGAASPGLDVEERAVRVHLPTEHAPELEVTHLRLQALCVALDVARRGLIALAGGELEQLAGLADALGGPVDLADLCAQSGAFAPEL